VTTSILRAARAGFPAVLLAWVAAGATPAQAHATFETKVVPPDGEGAVTMLVPHERDEATYNVRVLIAVPPGWTALDCRSKETWTCELGDANGAPTITFAKEAGAARAEDERFEFAVRSPGPGAAGSFPTQQVYSNGEVVSWSGAPGSPEPAALLQTAAAGQAAVPAPAAEVPPGQANPAPAGGVVIPPASTPLPASAPAASPPPAAAPATDLAAASAAVPAPDRGGVTMLAGLLSAAALCYGGVSLTLLSRRRGQ
jgi:uncharacterized protein YcnI